MERFTRFVHRSLFVAVLFGVGVTRTQASGEGGNDQTQLNVICSRASSMVQIQLAGHHKIGKLVMEIKDLQGRVLYREEGKAMTGELVRRLDKGTFPRGTHELTVVAKDFAITQRFTIE